MTSSYVSLAPNKFKISQMKSISLQFRLINIILLLVIVLQSCNNPANRNEQAVSVQDSVASANAGPVHPEWSRNAVIYEVNIRQYTPEGTFASFQERLPELKELGVDILWLMPVHPIGVKNRKGTLGSYYSVKDYKAVNPEFGTDDDFRTLVNKAHELGFKVILDWVANHTAWDHDWVTLHPDWYTHDSTGKIVSPFDWSDVADLNYDRPELRDAMIDALKYWVQEFDIDGYRCDVAGMVPVDFWNRARKELDSIKPVFMLAEAEEAELHKEAFDMTYAWELHHIFNQVAGLKEPASAIAEYYTREKENYPADAYRMVFTSNHDENSWNGTVFERLDGGAEVFAVLTYALPGMPLIYTGQEAGMNKRLEFFEKDLVPWNPDHPFRELYTNLNRLKHQLTPLYNGIAGGDFVSLENSLPGKVLSFYREKEGQRVVMIANLSPDPVEVSVRGVPAGDYKLFPAQTDFRITEDFPAQQLAPWAYIFCFSE
ncbi:MAG: alpha-amylase family glycosyl hydrolase [Bacteroidales bacterium]